MNNIHALHILLRDARRRADLTQRELASRVGTSQSAIAALEQGATNPTIDTLRRCATAVGLEMYVTLEPLAAPDAIVQLYKRDVDRGAIRENLRTSVDDRLRTLSEWQQDGRELQRVTTLAKRSKRTVTAP